MKKISLLVLLLLAPAVYAKEQPLNESIDPQLTEKSDFKRNTIVFTARYEDKKAENKVVAVYRKFLGVNKEGDYLVQDFGVADDKKLTEPYKTNKEGVQSENPSPQNSPFVAYHTNGVKRSETHYKQGKLDGFVRFWHDNGQLLTEGVFQEGMAVGVWHGFHNDGSKFFIINIMHNSVASILDFPFSNGRENLSFEGMISEDHLERLFSAEVLYGDGQKFMKIDALSHSADKIMSTWSEEGQLMAKMVWSPDGTVFGEAFYPTGEKFSESRMLKGRGYLQIGWSEEGQKISEQFIADTDNKTEESYMKYWDENGSPIIDANFPHDN